MTIILVIYLLLPFFIFNSNIKNKLSRKLNNNIECLENLLKHQMINDYLNANVFICPSSIENSPNSLGEAQMLGVPVIASYVGGIPNMVTDGFNGLLYRFEEVEMLAYQIKQLFTNKQLINLISDNAITSASNRHEKKCIIEN